MELHEHRVSASMRTAPIARTLCIVVLLLVYSSISFAAEAITEGVWVNGDGDGWIELAIIDGGLRGSIIGSPDDPDNRKPSRLDIKNPDKALRSRPLLGLTILSGFRPDGEGRWAGGRVYDPNSGRTYSGTITIIDPDTLKLRGYIGISLFGRTETWRRRDAR